MPRSCTICIHEQRNEIERAVVLQTRYRKIAALYSVSESAISRHVRDHILPYMARVREAECMERAATLVDRLDEITSETRAILRAAREEGGSADDRALRAIRRIERQLELEAKIFEVIPSEPTVNVLIAPKVQIAIVKALEPFPDAQQAVADALGALELEEGESKNGT